MPPRLIAVGDIHGCRAALDTILEAIKPRQEDRIILLGDYVDRGNDVRGTIDRLIRLKQECQLYPLMGNHEEMFLDVVSGKLWKLGAWMMFGGVETMESYGSDNPQDIPPEHIDFLRACHPWCETEHHLFVHANYLAKKPMKKQPANALRWESLNDRQPGPHKSGKIAVVGHTAQKTGQILDLGYLMCIDTCCYGEGLLTAVDVYSGQIWQADKEGNPPKQ